MMLKATPMRKVDGAVRRWPWTTTRMSNLSAGSQQVTNLHPIRNMAFQKRSILHAL